MSIAGRSDTVFITRAQTILTHKHWHQNNDELQQLQVPSSTFVCPTVSRQSWTAQVGCPVDLSMLNTRFKRCAQSSWLLGSSRPGVDVQGRASAAGGRMPKAAGGCGVFRRMRRAGLVALTPFGRPHPRTMRAAGVGNVTGALAAY